MGFTAKALTCVDRQVSERITVGWNSARIQPAEAGSSLAHRAKGSECDQAVLNSSAGPLLAHANSPDNVRFVAQSKEVNSLYISLFRLIAAPFSGPDEKIPLTAAEFYMRLRRP